MSSEAPPTKVWLDMDQAALDAAYDQAVYAPNSKDAIGRMVLTSAALRDRVHRETKMDQDRARRPPGGHSSREPESSHELRQHEGGAVLQEPVSLLEPV